MYHRILNKDFRCHECLGCSGDQKNKLVFLRNFEKEISLLFPAAEFDGHSKTAAGKNRLCHLYSRWSEEICKFIHFIYKYKVLEFGLFILFGENLYIIREVFIYDE